MKRSPFRKMMAKYESIELTSIPLLIRNFAIERCPLSAAICKRLQLEYYWIYLGF